MVKTVVVDAVTVTYEMDRAKETKGTVVFKAENQPVDTMYVSKMSEVSKGNKIKVTIERVE